MNNLTASDRKATVSQTTTAEVCRRTSLNAQLLDVEADGRCRLLQLVLNAQKTVEIIVDLRKHTAPTPPTSS